MPWYSAYYRADGQKKMDESTEIHGYFGSEIYGKDLAEAKRNMKKRGMNEWMRRNDCVHKKMPYELPSKLMRAKEPKPYDILHAMCWVAHMALKSGVASVEETVGDRGFVHDYVHYLDHICDHEDRPKECQIFVYRTIHNMLVEIENKIPGLVDKPGKKLPLKTKKDPR